MSCNIVIVTVQDLATKPQFACAPFEALQEAAAAQSQILHDSPCKKDVANGYKYASKQHVEAEAEEAAVAELQNEEVQQAQAQAQAESAPWPTPGPDIERR